MPKPQPEGNVWLIEPGNESARTTDDKWEAVAEPHGFVLYRKVNRLFPTLDEAMEYADRKAGK